MAERTRDDAPRDEARKDLTPKVISLARRRILKAGLIAPVILTLRSRPLSAQTINCSAWTSANLSHHYRGLEPEPCKTVPRQY
jgi:hypothetical protein